jgi:hypothetical protein
MYDPMTGDLIWRERSAAEFASKPAYMSFMSRRLGKVAGFIDSGGYRQIVVDGQGWLGHKLVWLFVHKEWVPYPEYEIDHVNGKRADNRIQNLRKVTKSANQRNSSMRVNNKSGVHGVNWVKSKRRWVARIWDGPRHVFLGQFKELSDAALARAEAERRYGYHPGHGKHQTNEDT